MTVKATKYPTAKYVRNEDKIQKHKNYANSEFYVYNIDVGNNDTNDDTRTTFMITAVAVLQFSFLCV
jgi:hypothetical protein